MAPIDRGNGLYTKAFCGGHHGCVGCAEWQVAVSGYQLRYTQPVRRRDGFDGEMTGREVAQKPHFGVCAQPATEKVDHFGDHECRDDQRPRMCFEKFK